MNLREKFIRLICKLLRMKGIGVWWYPGKGASFYVKGLTAREVGMAYIAVCAGIRDTLCEADDADLLKELTMSPATLPALKQEAEA